MAILGQLKTYLGRLAWIAGDALRLFAGRIVLVLLLNLLGIALTVATLGGIIRYVQHLESVNADEATPFVIPIVGLELAHDATSFMIFGVILATLGVLAAVCVYWGEWSIAQIAVDYRRRCLRRIIEIAADPDCRGWSLYAPAGEPLRALRQLAGMPARLTAFALREMLRSILPAATLLIAIIALILVDRTLVLILLPLAVLYLIPFYLINRKAARLQLSASGAGTASRKRLRSTLLETLDTETPRNDGDASENRALDDAIHDDAEQLFWKRKLIVQRMAAVNAVWFTLCLTALFAYFAYTTGRNANTWAEFFIALIALRFVFGGIGKTTAHFVKLSRFLPEYRKLTEFIDRGEALRARRAGAAPMPERSLVLRAAATAFVDSANLVIPRGGMLVIVGERRATDEALEAAVTLIEDACVETPRLMPHASVLCNFGLRRGGSPRDALPKCSRDDRQEIIAIAEALDLGRKVRTLLADDSPAPSVEQAAISRRDATALILAAHAVTHEIVVVNASALPDCDGRVFDVLLASKRKPIMMLYTNDASAALASEAIRQRACGVIVVGGGALLGCGDVPWFLSNLQDITAQLADARRGATDNGADVHALDLDDELDD